MYKADYFLYADWDGDGDFYLDPLKDLSAYLLDCSWESGSDNLEPGQTRAGVLRAKLDNSTAIFSPDNVSSPIYLAYGPISPGIKVRVEMKVGMDWPTPMWTGYLESIDPIVGEVVGVSTAELLAYGVLAQFREGETVDIEMQTDIQTGIALGLILNAIGFPNTDRAIDQGLSTLSRFWTRKARVLDAIRELEAAEAGLLGESKYGYIVFEDRSNRATYHSTPRSAYGTGTLRIWNLRQENPLLGIYNQVEANCRTFNISEDVPLAILVDIRNAVGGPPIEIEAGATEVIEIEFPNPSTPAEYLAVNEWGMVDSEVNTAADGTGVDITNEWITLSRTETARKLKLTFTDGRPSGGTAYFIVLRAHGTAIVESDPIPVTVEDPTSKGKYRKRSYPNPSQWLTHLDEAHDYCDHIVALRKDPHAPLRFDLKANYDAVHLLEAQTIDSSDRIHIEAMAEFGLFVNGDYYVEWVRHTVDSHRLHTVSIFCVPVVEHNWPASGQSYTPQIVGDEGVPDDLYINAIANGNDRITFGIMAGKYNASIDMAEFRFKYWGLDPNFPKPPVDMQSHEERASNPGWPDGDIDNGVLITWKQGYQRLLVGAGHGGGQFVTDLYGDPIGGYRTYYAGRMHNRSGWSRWTDGNIRPRQVVDMITLGKSTEVDSGPPSGWSQPVVLPGIIPHSVVVRCGRPVTNGHTILAAFAQIKDASTGSWLPIDSGTDPAEIIYDGSAIEHTYCKDSGRLAKASGDFGAAAKGHLILVDVRGEGNFDRDWCQWGTVEGVEGNVLTGLYGFRMYVNSTGYETWRGMTGRRQHTNVRIMIVKPLWDWASGGYQGGEPNQGIAGAFYWANKQQGDTTTTLFVFGPIKINDGVNLANIQATVWFENMVCRSNPSMIVSPYTQGVSPGTEMVILVDEEPIATDASLANLFQVTLGASRTLANPTNAKDGQIIKWTLIQDGTGGWTITLDTKFRLGDSPSSVVLSTDPYKRDYLTVAYNLAADMFDVIDFKKGYY